MKILTRDSQYCTTETKFRYRLLTETKVKFMYNVLVTVTFFSIVHILIKILLVLVSFDISQKVMLILSFGFRLNHFGSNILRNSSVNYNGCPYNGIIEIPMLST